VDQGVVRQQVATGGGDRRRDRQRLGIVALNDGIVSLFAFLLLCALAGTACRGGVALSRRCRGGRSGRWGILSVDFRCRHFGLQFLVLILVLRLRCGVESRHESGRPILRMGGARMVVTQVVTRESWMS
jgi:hypothetical protein